MKPRKPPKLPKCKMCQNRVRRHSAVVCGMDCAIAYANQQSEKKARRDLAAGRIKLKSLTDWLNDAQSAFNAWIRQRDGNFCISCQKLVTGQTQAGHYRSRKAASQLRFNESNCHSQCATCNTMLSGNLIEYRINLVNKIGVGAVMALECNKQTVRYTVEWAKAITKEYKARLKT